MKDATGIEHKHPIQVVARRSGLSADVLRAWEKRYQAVVPGRSSTGRRLYSDADIERLTLIRQAIGAGRRIGDVANLERGELQTIVEEDRTAASGAVQGPAGAHLGREYVEDGIEAVRAFDAFALRTILDRALFTLVPEQFTDHVASPLLQAMGDMWTRQELTSSHEHLASTVMRQIVSGMVDALQPGESSPRLVVATPSGQMHEFGALLAAVTACLAQWRVTYLGTDLPGSDIGGAALSCAADAVALSITYPDANTVTEVHALSDTLGDKTPLLIGGRAAEEVGAASKRRIIRLRDLPSLRAVLETLQTDR